MKEHITQLRVRYAETDQMGVVYYSNYFVWFEVARVEYFRDLGADYNNLEKKGIYLIVADAACRYLAPALYDEMIFIKTRISCSRNVSLRFSYEARNSAGKLLATGETGHAFVNKNKRPIKIPPEIKGLFSSC